MIQAIQQIAADLEEKRWDGGIRIIVQGAMRAVKVKSGMDMEASWRADVFTEGPRQRQPSFTLVAVTPERLLRDLAAMVKESRTTT